jgi:hypothetical protein
MPIVNPKNIQNQPYEQLQLADGGSVNFSKVPQLVSSIGDNTRQEYGGEKYNIKKVPDENYLYTFETKGGEKKYLMRVSKAGYNSKKTLPFTSQGKKEALKFRNEFLKDLAIKTEGEVLDPSIKKLSDGRFRYRRPNKKIEYFNTKKEAEDFRKFILQNKAKQQTIKLTGGFINNVRKGINEGKSQNQLADELGVNVKKISKAIQEGNIKLPENIVDNLEYRSFVKKNYKDKTTETIAKELFTDKKIPLSTKKSRVHNIIGTLIADGELEPVAASSKSEIRDRYGFGKNSLYEIQKKTREQRKGFVEKTSLPETEYQIRKLKEGEGPQLAHRLGLEESAKLGQQYDIGNLGIDPPKINQEVAKSFENLRDKLVVERDAIAKKIEKNPSLELRKQLLNVNEKIKRVVDASDGRIQAFVLDEQTLKPIKYLGIKPRELAYGVIDETVKDFDLKEINKILRDASKTGKTTPENWEKIKKYQMFVANLQNEVDVAKKENVGETIKKLENMIGGLGCPTYAIGGRVNFSGGSNCFNKGLKALEEGKLTKEQLNVASRVIAESGEEASVLKNILSKAGTGIKFTGRGVAELLSIGTGPIGVAAGAVLETAFAAPYLLEGDYKQALRQSIFGQVPSWLGVDVGSRDEDIIKGAKEAGVDPDSVKKYVELKKNYIENEEYGQKLNMLDTMYKRDPKNLDYAEQIRRIENKIKPSADYLEKTVYSPKDLDKYEKDYLKAASYFVQKNAAQAPFTRSGEQIKSSTRDIVQESLSAVRPEGDVENILKKENLLPQEAPPPEDLPSEYKISAAEGGRVELGDGSGPKIGRRGFLGLIAGAAAAPDLIKSLKGTGQVGKIASKIKIEPAEGMYPWFPKLVEKIKDMGKPFKEKDLIMEPSYKNDPRPFGSRQPTGEEKLTKHVDGDTTFILREYPDGRIAVDIDSPRNQESFGQPVSLYYRPKMEFQNYKGEKKIEPPEFKVLEPEPRLFANGPDDVDITFTEVPKNPKQNTVFGDIEAAERFATGNIKNRKIIPVKQSLRNEMEEDPSTFIMRQSGELGSKARPEEIIKLPEEFATGGRVGFGDGSKDPNKLIPIDPLLQDQSPTDPGRRDVLKLGIAGAGVLGLGKLGLLKLGSSIKPSIFAEAVKGTTAPSWMDSLMTKIIKEGTEIKMPKESSIIKKEVKFKNPETGDAQTATLTIDPTSDRMFIEYDSPTNVAKQPVVLELYRERKIVPNPGGESNWFAPDKTKGYNFYATETGPRVTDWDGTIEFDREDTYRKIIELKSDISGLKSYATEGKGINKKVAKEKRAATADIEKNPDEYVPDWEPEIYD